MDQADRNLDAQLNGNSYDESQLITFKVPITRLSYYNPSSQWERVDGSIEIGNSFYKYVKRRVLDDSLEVLCIPNSMASKLQAMKRQGSHPLMYKLPAPEPYEFTAFCSVIPPPARLLVTNYYYSVFLPNNPRVTEERPPSFLS